MTVRSNRFYNDPNLGAAFSNLANAFAPPSGSDLNGYAEAAARREHASRLATLFTMPRDKDFDQQTFDRLNVAAGNYNPTQSYYAQDQNSGVAIRGQDVTAHTALQERQMQEAGALARDQAKPVLVGEGQTALIPQQTVTATGLPGMFTGAVKLNQGERATLPNGQVLNGAPKPLTVDELNAQNQQRLQSSGRLTDNDLVDVIMGKEAPVRAIGPDNTPMFMSPGAAVRTGAQPARPAAAPSDLSILQAERASIAQANPTDSRLREYDARIGAMGRGAAQDAYSVENDKSFAKRNDAIQSAAQAAQSKLGTLSYIGQLLNQPGIDTGTGAGARLGLRKAAQQLGIDVGDVGSSEALQAVSNQFALELRNPESGAGMPGALSDSDRRYLQSMVPGLQNTPEGNRKILDFASRVAQRNVDIERMRQAYVHDHGRIDEPFAAMVTDFAATHPLFSDPSAAPTPDAAGLSGSNAATADPLENMPAPPDVDPAIWKFVPMAERKLWVVQPAERP